MAPVTPAVVGCDLRETCRLDIHIDMTDIAFAVGHVVIICMVFFTENPVIKSRIDRC